MASVDDEENPARALTRAVVAMVAVALLVGASVGLAMVAAAKIGGLTGGSTEASGPQADSPASLYMPPYQPTKDAGNGLDLPGPVESPSALPSSSSDAPATTKPKAGGITLFVAPQQVNPGARINFNGVYNGAEGAALQIQRQEGGAWTDFPVSASVRGGSFETWIMTSRTGRAKFRVYDESADKASNVVVVQIG
jgi:hypothetical protein